MYSTEKTKTETISIIADKDSYQIGRLSNVDKRLQKIHKQLGLEIVKPYKSKVEVIREFGFPIISKAKAKKIENLQKSDSPKQTFIHAIMTGDMGEQGTLSIRTSSNYRING